MHISIDKEFKSVVPKLNGDELKKLTNAILSDGCRDALVVCEGVLIDGHNRFDICTKHKIPFATREKQFKDRHEAINWIIENQLSRRNLTPEQKRYLIGKMYAERKQSRGGNRGNQYTTTAKGQNDPLPKHECDTAAKIAKEQKVSKKTVRRSATYSKSLDVIAETLGSNVKDDILSRLIKIPEEEVIRIAMLPQDQMMDVIIEYHPENRQKKRNDEGLRIKKTAQTEEVKGTAGGKAGAKKDLVKTIDRKQILIVEKINKLIGDLDDSDQTEQILMNHVLPRMARKYHAIDMIYNMKRYSAYVLQVTHQINEKSRDLAEQQKINIALREEIDTLKNDLKGRKTECKTLCKHTNERVHDQLISNLKYSLDTIKQHLFAHRHMQDPADRQILEQLTMNDFFNFLTVLRVITMSDVTSEKAAKMLGVYKSILQLDECKNIRVLPRLKERLAEMEEEFKQEGLSKTVTAAMVKREDIALLPDQHMEKRLMLIGIINKTEYLRKKDLAYQAQLSATG